MADQSLPPDVQAVCAFIRKFSSGLEGNIEAIYERYDTDAEFVRGVVEGIDIVRRSLQLTLLDVEGIMRRAA